MRYSEYNNNHHHHCHSHIHIHGGYTVCSKYLRVQQIFYLRKFKSV